MKKISTAILSLLMVPAYANNGLGSIGDLMSQRRDQSSSQSTSAPTSSHTTTAAANRCEVDPIPSMEFIDLYNLMGNKKLEIDHNPYTGDLTFKAKMVSNCNDMLNWKLSTDKSEGKQTTHNLEINFKSNLKDQHDPSTKIVCTDDQGQIEVTDAQGKTVKEKIDIPNRDVKGKPLAEKVKADKKYCQYMIYKRDSNGKMQANRGIWLEPNDQGFKTCLKDTGVMNYDGTATADNANAFYVEEEQRKFSNVKDAGEVRFLTVGHPGPEKFAFGQLEKNKNLCSTWEKISTDPVRVKSVEQYEDELVRNEKERLRKEAAMAQESDTCTLALYNQIVGSIVGQESEFQAIANALLEDIMRNHLKNFNKLSEADDKELRAVMNLLMDRVIKPKQDELIALEAELENTDDEKDRERILDRMKVLQKELEKYTQKPFLSEDLIQKLVDKNKIGDAERLHDIRMGIVLHANIGNEIDIPVRKGYGNWGTKKALVHSEDIHGDGGLLGLFKEKFLQDSELDPRKTRAKAFALLDNVVDNVKNYNSDYASFKSQLCQCGGNQGCIARIAGKLEKAQKALSNAVKDDLKDVEKYTEVTNELIKKPAWKDLAPKLEIKEKDLMLFDKSPKEFKEELADSLDKQVGLLPQIVQACMQGGAPQPGQQQPGQMPFNPLMNQQRPNPYAPYGQWGQYGQYQQQQPWMNQYSLMNNNYYQAWNQNPFQYQPYGYNQMYGGQFGMQFGLQGGMMPNQSQYQFGMNPQLMQTQGFMQQPSYYNFGR